MAEGDKIGREGLPRRLQGVPWGGGRAAVGKSEERAKKGVE